MLKLVSFSLLLGEKITAYEIGHPEKKNRNSYGVLTLHTESGKKFVLHTSMLQSEISLSEEQTIRQ